MDKDFEDYKDFDMSGAVRGIPEHIRKLQARKREEAVSNLFEPDVCDLLIKHKDEKERINAMLRLLLV